MKSKSGTIKGFTLIEVITGITILIVLFAIGIGVFASVLRGSDKATMISEVSENGTAIIETFNRTVHSSSSIKTCSGSTLEVWDQDQNTYSRLQLTNANFKRSTGEICAVVGPDCFTVNYVELGSRCSPASGTCADTSRLGNTHPQTGVNIQSLTFTCSASVNVRISLTVKQAVTRTSNEEETQQIFETSAEVRRY